MTDFYYPKNIKYTHGISDWTRVQSMVCTVESGGVDSIPPILLFEGALIDGHHRWVANEMLEKRGKTDDRISTTELEVSSDRIRQIVRLMLADGMNAYIFDMIQIIEEGRRIESPRLLEFWHNVVIERGI